MQQITDRITALMERYGLSLTGLAEAAAIPRMTLTRRLNDPSTFTLGELERVAAVIKTTADALVSGDEQMPHGSAA